MSSVDCPHFDLPFRLGKSGANLVEQDSLEDVVNCVVSIMSTHVGFRDEQPEFGIPDLAMRRMPIGEDDIHTLVGEQEPRALMIVNEYPDQVYRFVDHINIGVSIVQKGG